MLALNRLKFLFGFIETPVRIPRFNGHSHLEYAGLGRTVLAFTELEAVIKPEAVDGMVLYNGYTLDRKGDFLALALRNGFVEFSFDLGTGPARIRFVQTVFVHKNVLPHQAMFLVVTSSRITLIMCVCVRYHKSSFKNVFANMTFNFFLSGVLCHWL